MLGISTDDAEMVARRAIMNRYFSIKEAEAGGACRVAGPL